MNSVGTFRGWASLRLALLATLALGGCGGGVEQVDAFVADRVIVFGDESSALTSDGRRWGINGLDASGTRIDCEAEPLWVQSVASLYGYRFAACIEGVPDSEPRALMYAQADSKVADLSGQIDNLRSTTRIRNRDLALVMAGANDIWALYEQFPGRGEADLLSEARARGEQLANAVNGLIALGARVILVTLPDLGLSPDARAQSLLHAGTGFDRAALVSRLVAAFNERLILKVVQDGRQIGLALWDQTMLAVARDPGSYGFSNISDAACTRRLPDCTTATLTQGATSDSYLWADGRRLSPGAHAQIASLALARARGNPF